MSYSCKIVADSLSPAGVRLTTFEITFPRMVLAEFNTHRMFSRNSASSRAIPIEKQLARVMEDPFIPVYWGKNQKGMQASEELSEADQKQAVIAWLKARDRAIEVVNQLNALDVHKQTVNRLLEPFMWHTVIVTATEWSNFFNLRANPMAQPEIQNIAYDMLSTYNEGRPTQLVEGQWHLPYAQPGELEELGADQLVKLCAARCARVSYLTHDGKRDISADFTLYDRLVDGGHMSPLEHPARPMTDDDRKQYGEFKGNFRGWVQHRALIPGEADITSHRRKANG